MILFLPPTHLPPDPRNVNDFRDLGDEDPQRVPKVFIERIYKSKHALVYEIVDDDFIVNNAELQAVSTQLSIESLQKLYSDLNYTMIDELFNYSKLSPDKLVNVFVIVKELLSYCDQSKCTSIIVSDYLHHQVTVKLWRGLSAWNQSLSPGCRIQIRNLLFKSNINELHSTSSSEVYLLGSAQSNIQLSARAHNLSPKEREILRFLEEQSILIPRTPASNLNVSLTCPFYLEHFQKQWRITGCSDGIFNTIIFERIDAKIWSIMNELFFESTDDFISWEIYFSNLSQSSDTFTYMFTSPKSQITTSFRESNSKVTPIKQLSWEDLLSLDVVLFGVYEIEGVLDQTASYYNQEESLGNLSASASLPPINPYINVLKCPKDLSKFIQIDGDISHAAMGRNSKFKVKIKTLLHDGNVEEIVNKSVHLMNSS